MKRITGSIALCLLINLFAAKNIIAQPAAGYTNPVLRGVNPDPSVCCVGDDF